VAFTLEKTKALDKVQIKSLKGCIMPASRNFEINLKIMFFYHTQFQAFS
jgi:hypothetical protein